MDLSPNYAGTMMGMSNMVANVMGFVTPMVIGFIIEGNVSVNRRENSNYFNTTTFGSILSYVTILCPHAM